MPMASVSASNVTLLIEKPRKYMIAKVETIDAGIAIPGIMVARRFRRNRKMMTITSPAAISSVSWASVIERRTKVDASNATSSDTPGGSCRCTRGSSAWMASATCSRFDLDWRMTPTATARVPLYRSTLRSFSGPSSTVPRSRNFTSCPPSLDTVMLPNSSGVLSSPSDRTENSRRWLSMRPAGTSTLRDWIADSTSWTVMPLATSSSGSSQIRIE